MNKPARSFVLMAAAALALSACSSNSNSSQKAAQSQLGAITSAVAQGANASDSASSDGAASSDSTSSVSSDSSSSTSSGTAAASVDACSLLTAADVNAVAQANKLDTAQTASTVYTLEATKAAGLPGDSVCNFEIENPAASLREGTIECYVADASDISDYTDGAKVSGLGDEAYAIGTNGFAVRVGSRELVVEDQDYFSAATVTALLHKMIPRLNS